MAKAIKFRKVNKAEIDPFMITNWLVPSYKMDTEYGRITKREWVAREMERIGNGSYCVTIEGGRVGLAGREARVAIQDN